MKIGIACDHHGVRLKRKITKYLEKKGYEVINFGTDNTNSVDYPDYAYKVCSAKETEKIDYGFLICGTGIGMCIAANKMKDIRCARVFNKEEARMCRLHNNCNILAISSKMHFFKLKKIIDMFLETAYSNLDRHNIRIKKLEELR